MASKKASKSPITADGPLPEGFGAPARRALVAAGYSSLRDLTRSTEEELLELHGMGPKAIRLLGEMLKDHKLSFAKKKN